jgi:hypothetical protein
MRDRERGRKATTRLSTCRFCEIQMRSREDITLWGKSVAPWTKFDTAHLDRNAIRYEEDHNGELSVPSYSLALSFDELGHGDFIEMWASNLGAE